MKPPILPAERSVLPKNRPEPRRARRARRARRSGAASLATGAPLAARASLAAALLVASPAGAVTLEETLLAAWRSNPALLAARRAADVADTQITIAYTAFLPRVEARLTAGLSEISSESAFFSADENRFPRQGELEIIQPLFSGGSSLAQFERAQNESSAGRYALRAAGQDVLLSAAEAYFNLSRDQALLSLARNNENVLQRQLQSTRVEYEVGERTRTDVAQAEARLAMARAERIRRASELKTSRAAYTAIVGLVPDEASEDEPTSAMPRAPASMEQAVAEARAGHPMVKQAFHEYLASEAAADMIVRSILPSIELRGRGSRTFDRTTQGSRSESLQAEARLTIPLFRGGESLARYKEARHDTAQREELYRQALREAENEVRGAWYALEAGEAEAQSFQTQIDANQEALRGVRAEAEVGERTVLDVLNAENELFQSRAFLTRTRRDLAVARFRLMAAAGALTPGALGLDDDTADTAPAELDDEAP